MLLIRCLAILLGAAALASATEVVSFPSGDLTLHGVLYKPAGPGPFPAVLYNHGSAMDNSAASDELGPSFARHGWVFFMPHRRGQGLSASAGPYVRDEIVSAGKNGGIPAAASTMVRLLETDHLSDQLAALTWLQSQDYVQKNQIAVAGNSFGGIETVLGTEKAPYCAAVDLSGGAESWAQAPELRTLMVRAVQNSHAPILFIQAENDFDLSPGKTLAGAMEDAGKVFGLKIYPPFGDSPEQGHSFAYRGVSIWIDQALQFLNQHCGGRARSQ